MQRRRFLTALIGSIAATLPVAKAVAVPARRGVLIQESPIAGFQYHEGEHLWSRLRQGDALALVREPQNPYDPGAVRVDWQGQKLGYVPRIENTAASQMLDRGQHLSARILRLQESRDPWERVKLVIELEI